MRKQLFLAAMMLPMPLAALAAEGERVQVRGEIIDTWCYYSGVMGGPDAVTGSSHLCALVFGWGHPCGPAGR